MTELLKATDTAIEVLNLTKSFPVYLGHKAIKEIMVNLPGMVLGKQARGGRYKAIDSISFSVQRGECLGVIGKNGAGKSTLLSLLLGTGTPSSGEVHVRGKRTPLLELGAGFHPDLTGRENTLLNAVLLGLTRAEAEARLEEIIRFSEIEAFIDNPSRTYSSGMYLRLAFSVAIHTNPEIFLIDEIVAVGDEAFQKKSGDALLRLIKSGVTTVFVSHNMDAVRKMCTRAMWLEKGRIREIGDPGKVVDAYLKDSAKPAEDRS
jgi:ABC-type polysaccharide/polyol phosphate transport system ATPase subunit